MRDYFTRPGMQKVILAQLESKFGSLPSDIPRMIATFNVEKLSNVAINLLRAESLTELGMDHHQIEEFKRLRESTNWVNSFERRGIEKVTREITLAQLESKFSPISLETKYMLASLPVEKVRTIALDLLTAKSLAELGLEPSPSPAYRVATVADG
jgi:hypothetical protein